MRLGVVVMVGALAACQGQRGPAGAQGATGLQGPKGDPGAQGVQGPAGGPLVDVADANGNSLGPAYGLGPGWVLIKQANSIGSGDYLFPIGLGTGKLANKVDVYFTSDSTCTLSGNPDIFTTGEASPLVAVSLGAVDRSFVAKPGASYATGRSAVAVWRANPSNPSSSCEPGSFANLTGIDLQEVALGGPIAGPLRLTLH